MRGVGGERRRRVDLSGFAVIKQHATVRTTVGQSVTTGCLTVLCAFYYEGIYITCYWTLWYERENYIIFTQRTVVVVSGTCYKYTCVSCRALYTHRPLSPSTPRYMDHPVTALPTDVCVCVIYIYMMYNVWADVG